HPLRVRAHLDPVLGPRVRPVDRQKRLPISCRKCCAAGGGIFVSIRQTDDESMADAVTKPEDLLRQAGEALDNGDWAAARQLFSQALQRGEKPEALEGLAQTAFFLDEPELTLDARERAYGGYRDAGR